MENSWNFIIYNFWRLGQVEIFIPLKDSLGVQGHGVLEGWGLSFFAQEQQCT